MLTTVRRLARRALSAFTRIDRLFAFRARYADTRARLNVTALEERVVPDATPVRIEWVSDAEETGAQAVVRFTRTADQAEIDANALTVSFLASGSATPGTDFVFVGASAPTPTSGQPLTITFNAGQATVDLAVNAVDDTEAEGWESVAVALQEGTGYTLETAEPVTVWIADNELWLEADADPVLKGEEVTFWLPEDLPATATFEWDADYDGTTFEPVADETDSWFVTSFTSTGARTIAARVTDGTSVQIVTLAVDVEYPPPELTAPEDFTVTQGATSTLSVTADTELTITSVVWQVSYTYGDYETDESLTGLEPEYEFTDPGEYDFWVTVTDSEGGVSDTWFHVSVTNAAPDGNVTYQDANGAVGGNINEGSDVWFTVRNLGVEVDVSNLDGLSVYADWYGTGEYDLIAQGEVADYGWDYDEAADELRFKWYYDDGVAAGTYATKFWIEDEWGFFTEDTVNVQVKNVAPTATLSAGTHIATVTTANQEVWGIAPGGTLSLIVTEPSETDWDALVYTWKVNGTALLRPDGTPFDTAAVTLPKTLQQPGRIHAVEASVRDKDGGTSAVYQFNLAILDPDAPLTPPMATVIDSEEFILGPAVDPLSTEAGHSAAVGGGVGLPPGQGGPGGPGIGGGSASGQVFGTLTLNGAAASDRYGRYSVLPVVKVDNYGQSNLTVAFQLDAASVALATTLGATVRYKYTVEIYDVEKYSIGPDNFDLLSRTFNMETKGANEPFSLTISNFLLETPGTVQDRLISVTVIAQLLQNGLVTHTAPPAQALVTTPYSPTTVQQVRDFFQMIRTLAQQFADRANDVITAVTNDAGKFLEVLTGGLSGAATQYFENLPTYINQALFSWLGQGVLDPTKFDLSSLTGDGVKALLLQFSGLTWDNVQNILLQEFGEGNVAALSDFVTTYLGDNPDMTDPNTMLALVQKLLNPPAGLPALELDLSQMVTAVENQLKEAVQRALPQLMAKFIPGAGNIVGTVQAIHRGLTFVLDNQQQLQGVISKFLEGLSAFSIPDSAQATNALKTKLLEGLQLAGPLLLSFAASQLGLSRLPREVRSALAFVPQKVGDALRSVVRAVAVRNGGGTGTGAGGATGRLLAKRTGEGTFTYDGRTFVLIASTADKKHAIITLHERVNGTLKEPKTLTEKDFPAAADKALFNTYVTKANQLAAIKGTPRGQTPPPAQSNKLRDLKTLQQEVATLETALINRIAQDACPWLGTGCFAAGTKLLTKRGWVAVELLAVGDELASRAEADPGAEIEWQAVEECFRRTGRILHLHFTDGELIRTTPEHPFWVYGEGWVPAGALKAGDKLSTLSGEWVALREVYDTEQWEPTYNVRVANTHTYFVGDEHWGFALWAHNTYAQAIDEIVERASATVLNQNAKAALKSGAVQAADVVKFLKDSARIRVMSWHDFRDELESRLKTAGLMASNANYLFSGTQSKAAQATQAAALKDVKFAFPTPKLPNPFATGSQYSDHFQRIVLDQVQSPYYAHYLKFWNVLKHVYENEEQAQRDASRFQIEQLAWHFPEGPRKKEYEGLDWHLDRIKHYYDQNQLVQVESPPAAARTTPPDYKNSGYRVDIRLINNVFVDAKAWSQATWNGLDQTEKERRVTSIQREIENYLNANPDNTLKLEFRAFIPPEVTAMFNNLDPSLRSRVSLIGPPY